MEWRVIPGYDDYEASDDGRIRRATPGRGTHPGYILTIADPHYHVYRTYRLTVRGLTKKLKAATLVALAFHGSKPFPGAMVLHCDGDSQNDCAANLRWGSALENMQDARNHGTLTHGEAHSRAVLSDDVITRLVAQYEQEDITLEALAAQYGVSLDAMVSVLHGKTWKHLGTKMIKKGMRHGEKHHAAKLTPTQVRTIRSYYATGTTTQRALAQRFGVHQRTISKIVTGKKWRHLLDE